MEWTVAEILKITGGCLIQGELHTIIKKFSTDSRNVLSYSLFVPLKGPRFDGHQFIEKACQAGAVGFFKEPGVQVKSPGICIEVEDPLAALQKMAGHVRKNFKGPVVAITGSNGKTTTKEMLSRILTEKFQLLKSEGNFNNHIGLPLTLLNLSEKHQLILLEMGINHPGELSLLCKIAHPTLGIITSIGETHLEGLGNIEGVAQAKGELLDFLEEGTAVLNRDSPYYSELEARQKGKVVSFGLSEESDIRGVHLETLPHGVLFNLVYEKKEYPVRLSVPGSHNVSNALGAAASALMLGCTPEEVVRGLILFHSVPLRSELIDLNSGMKVISDAYNANPSSMEAALQMLADLGKEEKRKTIAILGDMLELGRSSESAHYKLGQVIGRLKIGRLFLYGPESKAVCRGAIENGMTNDSILVCPSHEALAEEVNKLISDRSLILIKGSRGMKMEKVLEHLKKE